MTALPTQPQTIGKVLDSGIKLYIRGLGKVLPIALVIALIGIIPDYVGNYVKSHPEVLPTDSASIQAMIIKYVAAYMVIVVPLSIIINGAMIKVYGDLGAGRAASVAGGLKKGLFKLFPILISMILYILVVTLGTVALVIPGIILMLSMYLFSVAIIVDDKGIIASLKFSHNLVWGNWWRTMIIFTVPFVIFFALYVLLGIVASLLSVSAVATAGSYNPNDFAQASWFSLVEAVINAIVYPLFNAIAVTVYHDLKVRKSGGDLEARLAGA